MKWYEELNLEENPFDVSSENTSFELIGRKKEFDELFYQIESGNMCFLAGKAGFGKTALLLTLQKEFDEKEVVYVDSNDLSRRTDLAELFEKNDNFVLLVDNVNKLSKQNLLKIKLDFDTDKIHAVVFSGNSLDLAQFDESIRERIGDNVISLKEYLVSDVIKIVKARLGEEDELIPEEVVERYYKKSEQNLKKLFYLLEKLCEKIIDEDLEEIDEELIDSYVIDDDYFEKEKSEKKDMICDICGHELIKIADYYRCPECDLYCPECGALIFENENSCPYCNVEFEFVDDEENSDDDKEYFEIDDEEEKKN